MKTYKNIWQQWIESIEKYITKAHDHHNITNGITSEEAIHVNTLLGFSIPTELIAFYSIYNFKCMQKNSFFSINIQNHPYTLLPFKRIFDAYESLLDLDAFDDDEVQRNYKDNTISERIRIEGFTNKGWIPFAETDQGDYLMFDTNPSDTGVYGQIIEFQNDSWSRNLVANNLEELILNQILFIEKNGSFFNAPTTSDTIILDGFTYKIIKGKTAKELLHPLVINAQDTDTLLLAKNPIHARSLVIHDSIQETNQNIQGYIFTENVTLTQCLYAKNESASTSLHFIKNIHCSNLIGNGLHINVQGNFHCEDVLCGKGENTYLTVSQNAHLNIVYAEDCTLSFNEISAFRAIASKNAWIGKGLDYYDNAKKVCRAIEYILPTHHVSEIFYDEYLAETSDDIWEIQWNEAWYTVLKNNSFEEDNDYDALYDAENLDDNVKQDTEIYSKTTEQLPTINSFEWQGDNGSYQISIDGDTVCMHYWHKINNIHVQVHFTKDITPIYHLFYMNENQECRIHFSEALSNDNLMALGVRNILRDGNDYLKNQLQTSTKDADVTMYQLIPMPRFGFGNADKKEVLTLKAKFGFSEDYARFLATYNGLNYNALDQDVITTDSAFATVTNLEKSNFYQDVACLYGIGELEEYYKLENANEHNIFTGYFFIIGRDPGGNEFVEVLKGKHQGYIGCIDHEMYAGNDSLEEFVEDMDLAGFFELDVNEQCNALSGEGLGLMALHAKSMKEFELEKLYISSTGQVYAQALEAQEAESPGYHLAIEAFEQLFGSYGLPAHLRALYDFEAEYGIENFTPCFYLKAGDKSGIATWSEAPEFTNAFIEFACANGSGSAYAIWLTEASIENCPIVVFGDEGGLHIVASSIKELIHLLTYDTEISVDFNEVAFYKDEDDYEESECRPDFIAWAKESLNLEALNSEDEVLEIVKKAQDKYQDRFHAFLEKFDISCR